MPGGRHRSVRQQDQPVGELSGQRQVVHGAEHGQPVLEAQGVDDLERVDTATEVEGAGGLVEEEDRRLLGQGPSEDETLQFAAGKGAAACGRRTS